jgi:hypothetical protein
MFLKTHPPMSEEFLSDAAAPLPAAELPREPVRHVLYGSRRAIARTIGILHVKGYAEQFEWSKLLLTETPGEYMAILSRSIRLE